MQLPEPKIHPIGYTYEELAEITGTTVDIAKETVDRILYYSTVSLHPDTGEVLVHPHDARRVVRAIESLLQDDSTN